MWHPHTRGGRIGAYLSDLWNSADKERGGVNQALPGSHHRTRWWRSPSTAAPLSTHRGSQGKDRARGESGRDVTMSATPDLSNGSNAHLRTGIRKKWTKGRCVVCLFRRGGGRNRTSLKKERDGPHFQVGAGASARFTMDRHMMPPRQPMMSQLAVALFDYQARPAPAHPRVTRDDWRGRASRGRGTGLVVLDLRTRRVAALDNTRGRCRWYAAVGFS